MRAVLISSKPLHNVIDRVQGARLIFRTNSTQILEPWWDNYFLLRATWEADEYLNIFDKNISSDFIYKNIALLSLQKGQNRHL